MMVAHIVPKNMPLCASGFFVFVYKPNQNYMYIDLYVILVILVSELLDLFRVPLKEDCKMLHPDFSDCFFFRILEIIVMQNAHFTFISLESSHNRCH